MTSSSKQVYTNTEFRGALVQKVQKAYGYDAASSLNDIEEHGIKGEIPTIIMFIGTDTNTKETYKIGLVMLYQADTTDYIKIRKEFKKNLFKYYTVICE